MKLPVVIYYEAKYRKRSGGRAVNGVISEIVEFDLEVATSEMAPVAVCWNDSPAEGIDIDAWGSYPAEGMCHTRWYKGQHFAPILMSNEAGPQPTFTDSYLASLSYSSSPQAEILGNVYEHTLERSGFLAVSKADEPGLEIMETSRQRSISQVEKHLSNLLCVDGDIYRRCAEPRILAYFDPDAPRYAKKHSLNYLRIVTTPELISRFLRNSPANVFSINEFDEVIDHKHLFTVPRIESVDLTRRPEVLTPEAINVVSTLEDVGKSLIDAIVASIERLQVGYVSNPQLRYLMQSRDVGNLPPGSRLDEISRLLESFPLVWKGSLIAETYADDAICMAQRFDRGEMSVTLALNSLRSGHAP